MADKTQDSIPTAAEQLRGLLVEAAQASQAGPTVGRQQAEAEAEIIALDRILVASDAALQALAHFRKGRSIARCEKAFDALEEARADAAALAEVGGNKRLAKACRAVAAVSQQSEFILKIEIKDADKKSPCPPPRLPCPRPRPRLQRRKGPRRGQRVEAAASRSSSLCPMPCPPSPASGVRPSKGSIKLQPHFDA